MNIFIYCLKILLKTVPSALLLGSFSHVLFMYAFGLSEDALNFVFLTILAWWAFLCVHHEGKNLLYLTIKYFSFCLFAMPFSTWLAVSNAVEQARESGNALGAGLMRLAGGNVIESDAIIGFGGGALLYFIAYKIKQGQRKKQKKKLSKKREKEIKKYQAEHKSFDDGKDPF